MFKQFFLLLMRTIKGSNTASYSPAIHKSPISMTPSFMQQLARRYEGKLLLREEIPLPSETFRYLLKQDYFTAIPAIQKHLFSYQCMRCHNKRKAFFANISCLRCNHTHVYCRNCIYMGRILACDYLYEWTGPHYNWPKVDAPLKWTGTLTPMQRQAAIKVKEVIKKKGKLLLWAVTGAGKTEMLFHGIAEALSTGQRVCIASPRADVIRELLPRLTLAFSAVSIQALFSGSRDYDGTAQLMLATTHQLLRYKRAFDVLIIDEIDAFPFHHDPSLKIAARKAQKNRAAIISLTATPRKIQHFHMATKQTETFFVPLRYHQHDLLIPKWIHERKLQKQLQANLMPDSFMLWLMQRKHKERQLLIFTSTIHLAQSVLHPVREFLLNEALISQEKEIAVVHAEEENRAEKIHAFRNQQIKILITTTILERGVTFPSIDVVILDASHEVFDNAALVQIAGRAGRSPTDPFGDVVLFHDGITEAMVRANKDMKDMNKRKVERIEKQEGKK